MLCDDGGDAGLHCVFIADVEGDAVADAAVFSDFGSDAVELVLLAPADKHRGAERRELVRGAAPDAAATAGDPAQLAGEQAGAKGAAVSRCRWGIHRRIRRQGDVNVNALTPR